jgi:sulfide:quinone oxidoreductase
MNDITHTNVLIAGGGVAGLECLIALRELAGDAPEIALLSPEHEFAYRPMSVLEPFSFAAAHRYPLAEIAADHEAQLLHGSLSWVDASNRMALTADDEPLSYDALFLALGATRYRRYEHALTVDDRDIDTALHGLIQDIEGGYTRKIAFVMPPRMGWPLPLYELALLSAQRAREMCVDVELTIVTPEDAPLAIFGDAASAGVSKLLTEAGITVLHSSYAAVPDSNHVRLTPGPRELDVGRIVTLPLRMGPPVRGLPLAAHGFIPVTPTAAVRGIEGVYAAGDATDFPVKHGGIAAQQADAAATSIAAALGFPVALERFNPVIRGMLLTGHAPLYLTAHLVGGRGFTSTLSATCPWTPQAKIAAKHLGGYLERLDTAAHNANVPTTGAPR